MKQAAESFGRGINFYGNLIRNLEIIGVLWKVALTKYQFHVHCFICMVKNFVSWSFYCSVLYSNNRTMLHTERCRSYRSYKYVPFTHYQSLRNSLCILSWFVLTGTSSEFFPPEYPPHWDIPTRSRSQ